ncbi:MAG TPA: HAD-IA family hydrolase [Gemmataceae bacterium]|nr:HAD-IA family hydrolase [Gemmataceae bacterium]
MSKPQHQTSRFRAVLFDFDGTLADSYPAITASVNHVRALHGLPPLSEPEVRRHVGRAAGYLLQHTVPAGSLEENMAVYRAHHPSVLRQGTRLLPGAAESLQALHERGLLQGVCSNKPVDFTRELVAYLGIASYLNVVLGPEDVPCPKPAPDMLRAALSRLNVAVEETLYIGDMAVDIQTARSAGVSVWVVPTGSDEIETLRQARPDRLLRDLGELRELKADEPEA